MNCATLRSWLVVPAFSALSLAGLGCGKENTCVGAACNAPPPDVGPLVAISTITFSPDLSMRTDTIQFADKLSKDGTIFEDRTIELAGTNSTMWASKNPGEMFLAEADSGNVIKYGVASDGGITSKGKIGFGAYGVTSFYWTLIAMESSKHAFLFDEKTLQGFIWNPDEMTISKNIDLKSEFNPTEGGTTYAVWRELQTIVVNGKFFASFHYYDTGTTTFLSRSGMIIMDPADDSFTVVEKQNCAGLHNSVLGKDGKIYSGSGVISAGANFFGAPGKMCLARFDPATMTWDDTYAPDIANIVDSVETQYVGGLLKNASVPDAPTYVRVLKKASVPDKVINGKNPLSVAATPYWMTYKLDDITNPTSAVDSMAPNAGGIIYPVEIDGKTYVSDALVPINLSWMVDLSVDPPTRALEIKGWGYNAVKFN